MAEFLIRAGNADVSLMERVLAGPPAGRPHRVVLDAHAALHPRIGAAARRAGVPVLIDPQTHYLQAQQHRADPWAQLPFATCEQQTPTSLLTAGNFDAVATQAIAYQLEHGATAIIAPYVHIENTDTGWLSVQLEMWRATRRFLDAERINLPLVAVLALGWRELDRQRWPAGLAFLHTCLRRELRPDEVALAASRVDEGSRPAERLSGHVAVIRHLRDDWPVLAWQQGTLGETAVAAGAVGYECGIGWRERCDLQTQMRSHGTPRSGGGNARPLYVDALGRSLPKRTVEALTAHPRIAAQLTCTDPSCCPSGQRNLLADARAHAIAARRRSLRALTQPDQAAWRWHLLAERSACGLDLAARINRIAAQNSAVSKVPTAALASTFALADHERQLLRTRAA